MPLKIILNAEDIRRTLARIAHEIIERNRSMSDLVLVGMRTRGVPLARRLAANVQAFEGTQIPVGALDISLYRDDLDTLDFKPVVNSTQIPIDIDRKTVVLVDDVLYTGRSARAAMDALIDFGRPAAIQLAVLIDRGHRELPIRAAMDALIDFGRPKLIQLAVLIDRGHRELPIRADFVGKNLPSSLWEAVGVHLTEKDGEDEVVIEETR